MGSLCFVCDLYSHSETAHGKSLWIHQKELKSCGSTRPFAHGKVRLYPWKVCILCVTFIPTVKLPMGNHYGYIKKNKRISHDVSRTKSLGLVLVYLTTRVVQPIGWKKKVNPETAARAGHIFVVLR